MFFIAHGQIHNNTKKVKITRTTGGLIVYRKKSKIKLLNYTIQVKKIIIIILKY